MSDADLLGQFVRNDSQETFAALVHRYINLVYSVGLRHTANPHNAEEITQAVFIILARKARGFPPGTVLSGWLYNTARLTAANFQRSEIRRVRREQEAYMQSTVEEPSPEPAWRELAPLLDQAMGRLKQTDRDALVLRYFENKSLQDVGRALGVVERAAQKRVGRALERLRKVFCERGIVLSTAVMGGALSANSVQAAPAALAATISTTALKGSAVAASTMTLASETTKLMTWMKIKFAMGVVGLVLLTGGVLTLTCLALPDKAPDIEGAWEGYTTVDGESIQRGESIHTRFVLKISRTNGSYHATIDAIDAGQKDIPMEKIIYQFPSLRLESSKLFPVNRGISMQGTVNAEGTEIAWKEGKHTGVIKRTTNPAQVPKRLEPSEFSPRDNSVLQGYWTGTLGAGPNALPLRWKIAEDSNGNFRAELDNPMQGGLGQPATMVYNPPAVDLIVRSGSGIFHGTLERGNTLLTGSWIQGGVFTPAFFQLDVFPSANNTNSAKSYAFGSPTDLQGHWKGSLQGNGFKLRLYLDVARLPEGTYSAELTSPDTPGNDSPIAASSCQYAAPNVIAKWNWIDAVLEAKLEEGKLGGTLKIGGLGLGAAPLTFERAASN